MFSLIDFAPTLKKKESCESVVPPSEFPFGDPFKRIGEAKNGSVLMVIRGGEVRSIPHKRLFKKEDRPAGLLNLQN